MTTHGRMVVILVLCGGLVACGYHLSGSSAQQHSQRFSSVLKHIALEGINRYDSLRSTLIAQLRSHGFKVTRAPYATAILRIENKRIEQRVNAIGADAKASEYRIRIVMDMSVVAKDGTVLLKKQALHAQTYYRNDPIRVLESGVLRTHAIEKAEYDLAVGVLNRLRALRR